METVTLIKQGVLFAHLLFFAIAVGEILRADWRMFRDNVIDQHALEATARVVAFALAGLWASGLALVYIDTGFDPALIAEKPKLIAKVVVVLALSANGALLHTVAFPMLRGGMVANRHSAQICSALGAISTVSWLYAAFVGVARVIAAKMTLVDFLALYGLGLAMGIGVALLVVAPSLERRAAAADRISSLPGDDEAKWVADLFAEEQQLAAKATEDSRATTPRGRRERSDRRVA